MKQVCNEFMESQPTDSPASSESSQTMDQASKSILSFFEKEKLVFAIVAFFIGVGITRAAVRGPYNRQNVNILPPTPTPWPYELTKVPIQAHSLSITPGSKSNNQ